MDSVVLERQLEADMVLCATNRSVMMHAERTGDGCRRKTDFELEFDLHLDLEPDLELEGRVRDGIRLAGHLAKTF